MKPDCVGCRVLHDDDPPCEDCRVVLKSENELAFDVFLLAQDQVQRDPEGRPLYMPLSSVVAAFEIMQATPNLEVVVKVKRLYTIFYED